ncbi:hypothetical protein [Actinomadura geliboluensis]|uniref:hypothetical protein n=1 Tax=Actinomadura geliboluensis TaxID=882440 RepID=UPI00261DABD5|nr:hypothetical protein [Actinomadura geliboluensis]
MAPRRYATFMTLAAVEKAMRRRRETGERGWKYPECEVWAGALNHADLNAVLDHIAQMPWRCPNALQVFVMDQEESFFRLWMLRDGELRQYAPVSPDENDPNFYPDGR